MSLVLSKQVGDFSLETVISHLLSFNKDKPKRLDITIPNLLHLSKKAKAIFEKENSLLKVDGTFFIFGDIHGQYDDLLRFLELTGLPPKSRLIFLGDYVDRGDYSVEVVALLFALKIKFPNHVFIIRGNHECAEVNKEYGFFDDCVERYNSHGSAIWSVMNKTLHTLPLALVVNDAVFCVHGGISPQIKSLDDINRCVRGTCIPENGILCDLTWSDPKQRQKTDWMENDRGVSFTFNENALEKFLIDTNIQMVCRAHQVVKNGYQFYKRKLICVFSGPKSSGDVGNHGAVMTLNENLEFSFIILKPSANKRRISIV
jgi:serine/threonine-protein phosphatase PP1 catalytic subunit